MSTLLNLPAPGENELVLTDDEMRRITGAGTKQLQIDWLKANGWQHSLTRGGEPRVGRLYANLKLSGMDLATIGSPDAWEPNRAALN